jgi:asparagine synthase (glutamine-hydrolysing)
MWNEDNTVGIVFNGEIYNHQELRKELVKAGHFFKSDHSDTEVLVHGWEEWGVKLLERLNGMYAFCLYDKNKKQLFLARDRFGEKPLYYSEYNGKFVFASELKSLLVHPEVNQDIDHVGLQKYFAYGFIPAPYTLYKNISKLPAGHYLVLDLEAKQSRTHQYWVYRINPDYNLLKEPIDNLAHELKKKLISSVNKRLVADVPVGVFLSGGIDSSSVLASALDSHIPEDVKTFSIGFNEKSFDESNYANQIASFFKTIHKAKIFEVDEVRNLASLVLGNLDEPMADSSILPTYMLAKFARETVTVALGGDGGDELFAGYAPFYAINAARIYCEYLPKSLRTFIKSKVDQLPVSDSYLSLDFKLKRTLRGIEFPPSVWNPVWLSPLGSEELSVLLNERVQWEEVYDDAIQAWNESNSEDYMDRSMEFYGKFYLQDGVLTKVDRASMMVGLEVRSPFLDNDVVEFSSKIPSSLKFRNGSGKYILKRSMKKTLPKNIIKRPKKGFGIPLSNWLKTWDEPSINLSGFNLPFVHRMFEEHRAGLKDNRLFLWAWIVLQKHFKNSEIHH